MSVNNTRHVRQALFVNEILEAEQAEQAKQANNDRLLREAEQAERASLALTNGDEVNKSDFDSMFDDTSHPSNDKGGNMREKYLKYKSKYLNLKKLK